MKEFDMFSENIPLPLEQGEQVNLLIEYYNTRNMKIREKIIVHNIRLVYEIVLIYFRNVSQFEQKELVSSGIIGLIKAVDNFNPFAGVKFSTYASRAIKNSIISLFRENINNLNTLSLDEDFSKHDDTPLTLYDEVSDTSVNIEKDYFDKEIIEIIHNKLNTLSDRDKQVIYLYFGFTENKRTYNQEEIASLLNISHAYVSKILRNTLEQLRIYLKINGYINRRIDSKKIRISNK